MGLFTSIYATYIAATSTKVVRSTARRSTPMVILYLVKLDHAACYAACLVALPGRSVTHEVDRSPGYVPSPADISTLITERHLFIYTIQ